MLGGRVGLAIWGWSGGRRKRWRNDDGVEVGPALWARSIETALLLSPTWVRTPDHRRVTGIVPCARSPPSLHQITHVHVPNPWREEASGWRAIIARHVGKASEHTTYGPACSWGLESEGASALRRHGMEGTPHRGGGSIADGYTGSTDGEAAFIRDRDLIGAPPGAHPRHGGWGRLGNYGLIRQLSACNVV